ncbi:TPA: hypothetical protein KEY68_001932 [Providencia rettgeri]|nr:MULTISPECIES: hypothetical protein [Providencia]EMB5785006.1 hypothetical protein [Providencia rettgeri]MBQ0368392.1 hypothetical protein [Providencia rettgeri]MDK7743752.1 hypothetical protein [Providencia rettgeri]MDK7756594.1 hypothetical protein [Providencia rettgeri]HBC7429666.1 hypothetical protein [Providencia rettgeri]
MEYEKNISGKPHPKFILLQPIIWLFKKLNIFIQKKRHEKYKGQKI